MANRRYIDFPIASTSGDTDIILIWQDGANKQTTKATFLSGLPTDLEDLNDVVISGLTNGQILRYDSVTGKWENTDQGNLDLNDLNDVSIVSPSNGQVLVYNSSTSKWENSSGGFVPYVGAVTTVDLGAQGLRAGYVRFDTTVAGVPNEQGLMFWDADDETVDIILNGYTMKIGEDLFYPVKNQTGSTIAKGVAVRFNGTVGNSGRLLIAPFIADGSVPSSRFMGVTAEEILNGEDGKVLYFGRVRGINTNAFNEGDILYASTTVAGGYQTAIPLPPNNIVQVAAVVTKSATVGTIFVRPTLGSNINTDEGVKITSVADKNLLQYQSGTSLWENKSLAQVLGGTSAQFVKGDGSLDSTSYGTGTVTSVGLSSATSGVTIGSSPVTTSGTITLAIATASGSQNGLLSSTDWTIFNNKQNALTNPVTGTGAQGRVAYWNGSGTITSDSLFQWNDFSKRLGIGRTPTVSLDVEGAGFFSGTVTASSIIKSGGTSSQYLMADGSVSTLTNPVTGTGATNYLPKFTGSTTIGNSALFDGGGFGGFNNGGVLSRTFVINAATSRPIALEVIENSNVHAIYLWPNNSGFNRISSDYMSGGTFLPLSLTGRENNADLVCQTSGNITIGTTTDNGAKLQVSGVISVTNSTADNNSGTILNTSTTGYGLRVSGGQSGDNTTRYAFRVSDYQNNPLFSVYGGGAATFSSSVTATGAFTTSGDLFLRTTGAVVFNSATNFNTQIYHSVGSLVFYTGANERMYITSSGNVLIGTATDSGARLNVRGSASSYPVSIEADGSGNQLALTRSGAITEIFMGGTSSGATQLYVRSGGSGGVRLDAGSTGWVSASDIRLKDITKPIENAVESLFNLQTIYYSWKDWIDKNLHIGLIAQEVEKVFPELVSESSIDGMKGVNYTELIPVLIAAVKELKQEIDTLKN